jgi:hypothetical protein
MFAPLGRRMGVVLDYWHGDVQVYIQAASSPPVQSHWANAPGDRGQHIKPKVENYKENIPVVIGSELAEQPLPAVSLCIFYGLTVGMSAIYINL